MPTEPVWEETLAPEEVSVPTWESSQPVPQWDETEPDTPPSLRAVVPSPTERPQAPRLPQNALEQEVFLNREQQQRSIGQAQERERGIFSPEQIQRLDEGSAAENLMSPVPGFEAPMVSGEDVLKRYPTMTTGNAKILAGVLQTAAGAWNFAASPVGAATLPVAAMAGAPGLAGLAGKSVLGGFAADAALNEREAIGKFDEAVRSGDPERIAQTASQLALNTFVALGAGKGTVDAIRATPKADIGAVTERAEASGLSQSAKALESVAEKPASSSVPERTSGLPEPLGVVPPQQQFIQKVVDHFTPPSPSAIPELRIEEGARLPRLQPYETEKLLASSPEGMARVPVLGALMDPRATAKNAADAPIITRAYSVHKGRTFASLWSQSQFRFKDIFKADEETGTIPLTNGERGYMSDVIEAELRDPGSQSITPEQRAWINEEWAPLREDVNRMLEQEGVREITTEDMTFSKGDYFPRPTIGKRNREAIPSGQTGGRPGAAPFFEKSRKYETEFEGARPPNFGEQKEQIIYDPDAISRATKFILGAYRSVADHRLANDPALGGQTIKERLSILKDQNENRLSLLDPSERAEVEAQLSEQAAYPIWGKEEQLFIAPAFAGKIFPIESSQRLKTAYAEEVRGWVKQASNITGATKALMATADMSGPFIQGAAMVGRHPIRWAKATANSYRALLDPNVLGKVLENPKYKTASEQFSQAGGSLLQLEDFLSGMNKGSFATRIPVLGPVIQATGRAYGVFLDLAKLELWDAWSKAVPTTEWGRVAEAIENSLFMGRMEKIGLNPHRAIGERLMAFAPAYYRGAGGLISTAFQRGVQGSLTRNMLAGYATAGALVTFGSWTALGLSQDEILKRLDPRSGTFMKVPVETGDGKRVEVGIGNVLTQLVRLAGQAADYHSKDKPIDTGVEGNPYLRFLRGRAAFLPSLGIEMATGRDYFGNRITIKEAVARRFMPFALQSMFPREPVSPGQRVMDSAFSFFGLNAFPESEYAAQLRHLDESTKSKSGKSFLDLPLEERAVAVKEFKDDPQYKKREPTTRDMERFIHINEERGASLRGALSKETRKLMDDLGIDAGGYKSTVTYKGVDVPLSKAEQKRYEELLAEEYNEKVPIVSESLQSLSGTNREKKWSEQNEKIRATARKRLMIEMSEK